ncbi:MAG TPA: xanthine dehydrogenase family protein molybdopterin-binding subunit [Gemmatimonadaceae bacterium]
MPKYVGQPVVRVDGEAKVTGHATYACEQWNDDVGQPLYGYIVGATIGKGRIARIDVARAERSPGVRAVLTHENAPEQGMPDLKVPSAYSRAHPALYSADVHHFGEPIALVIGDTLEHARAAAQLVEVEYVVEKGRFDFAANLDAAYAPKIVNAGLPTDSAVGDFNSAFTTAAVTIDQHYSTPYAYSQPMEPNAAMAVWRGDEVTVYFSSQILSEARKAIAATLKMDPQKIHLLSPYIGGGFGSKLGIHAETILAVLAARHVQQPVKVVLTRQQIFDVVSVRPYMAQHVRLGADRDGRLVAIGHDATMSVNPNWVYTEQTAAGTRSLYAGEHRLTRHRLVPLDIVRGEDVRSPGDAPGLSALESAMDELAYVLDMDPIELRIKNEPTKNPENGTPYSDRHLVECLREGAKRFGWARRPTTPATLRDGRWLVGYGVASASRKQFQAPSKARVKMNRDGTAVVQADMTDIGTGTYTIVAQVAADALDLPIDRVRVELGNTDYPAGGGSGGSFGASNTCVAVNRACIALKEKMKTGLSGDAAMEAEGAIQSMRESPDYRAYTIEAYGAHFVEVGVDADTGEIRLRRMLGVFAPGRVMNAKTAHSQLIGGMTWGVSMALHEEAVIDPRNGAVTNHDFASYLVPVNADIPEMDAVFIDSVDMKANELGMKGVGELGNCGASAAVANAVFNATGVRVRDFPITIEKLLAGLPADR